jgi:hypothetical protein
MTVRTRRYLRTLVVVLAATLACVASACSTGAQTCDTGVDNVELCTNWVESKNATREGCNSTGVLDADETCSSYESLNDPAVCGDCTEYFECLSSLTTCVDGGVVEGSLSDCPSSCD